jgi:arabinofuranosyltransferase
VGYYGAWLPNTYYAKATGSALTRLGAGATYLIKSVALGTGMLGALVWLRPGTRGPAAGLAGTMVVAGAAFILVTGGDWMPGYRFLVPLLPFIYVLVAAPLARLPRRCGSGRERAVRRWLWSLVLLHLAATTLLVRADTGVTNFYRGRSFPLWGEYEPVARHLAASTEPGALVALGEAGIIPYVSGRRVLDLFGLMDRQIARAPGGIWEKVDLDYVFTRRPDYLLLSHTAWVNGAWQTKFAYARRLLADPRFGQQYELRWMDLHFVLFAARTGTAGAPISPAAPYPPPH